MEKLRYSIVIDAPREKVWQTMLEKDAWSEWTGVFNPLGGSYYEGDWSQGSKMRFIGPDQTGKEGGMVSRVVENRPNEFISVEHIGIIMDGREDLDSAEARKWTPAFENYTLKENDGKTELSVEMDSASEYAPMFEEAWPKALEKLKKLAEAK